MLRWLIRRKLDSEEKKLGESVDYLRHVVDVSPGAFLRFASILPFANSRKVLPADAWFIAKVQGWPPRCGAFAQVRSTDRWMRDFSRMAGNDRALGRWF